MSNRPVLDRIDPALLAFAQRPVAASVILGVVLTLVMLFTDPMGFLSTDVGGKVATLKAMTENGTLSPDLGYWAEPVDPDGSLYPMWQTQHVDGKWINVTTLPMLVLAYPLYQLGGATAAGLVPILGTVATALGARSLAMRLGGDGVAAFWLVGLASPATIYALDLWEHSLGLALIVWAVVLVLDACQEERGVVAALGAGLCFGLAASMRQEAIVYGFVAGLVLGVWFLLRRQLVPMVLRGGALSAGFVVATVANVALERWLIGDSTRAGRSAGTAARIGGNFVVRLKEAAMTLGSPFSRFDPIYLVLAITTFAVLVELGRRADRPELPLRPVVAVLGAIAAAMLLDLVGNGLGFIPGLAATTPVAALAVTKCWDTPARRVVGVIALGSLPLVWAVQYTGGAGPQWGGRYILATGTLLIVVATVTFTQGRAARVLHMVTAGAAVVTLVGVAWTIERTHAFADAMRTMGDRPEEVLVFHDPHLAREGGTIVLDQQWLVATGEEGRREAADVLAELGVDEIGFVQRDRGDDPVVLPGWAIVETERVHLVSGLYLRVTTQRPLTE